MYAMRIQQELTAEGYEFPRPTARRTAAADADAGRRFLARSLAWERRLQQLRTADAVARTDEAAVSATDTPDSVDAPSGTPAPAARPATPVLA